MPMKYITEIQASINSPDQLEDLYQSASINEGLNFVQTFRKFMKNLPIIYYYPPGTLALITSHYQKRGVPQIGL
jgi:hypothetical protein